MKAFWLFTFSLLTSFGVLANPPTVTGEPVPDPTISSAYAISGNYDPNDINCEYGVELDSTLRGMINDFVTKCDSRVTAALEAPNLDERLRRFKDDACRCYNNERPTTLDDLQMQGMDQRIRRRVRSALAGRSVVSPEAINQNIISQNILLNEQRNGVMIQASILSPDPRERDILTNAYSGKDKYDAMIEGANKGLQRALSSSHHKANVTQQFAAPEFDPSSLQADGDSCPSMREFRHFRQFPEDNKFYGDLLSPRNNTYQKDDWNFEKLKEQLALVSSSKRILSLETAKTDPDTSWIIRRMDFLMRNPLLKNFFQQEGLSERKRTHLYNLVQQSFKPQDASCASRAGLCQGQAALKADVYQSGLREFFRDPDVVRRVVALDMNSMEGTLKTLPNRVATTPVIPNASTLSHLSPWMDRIMGIGSIQSFTNPALTGSVQAGASAITGAITTENFTFPTAITSENTCMSGTCDENQIRFNMLSGARSQRNADADAAENINRTIRLADINQTCNMLSDTNLSGHGFIFSQLEQEWSEALCDPSKPINGVTCTNPALGEMAGKVCTRNRPNSNELVTLAQFRAEGGCSDSTKNCLSEYISHTQSSNPESEQTAAAWTTVFNSAKISNFTGQETAQVGATINRNNTLSESDYVRTAGTEIVRDYNNLSRTAALTNQVPASTQQVTASTSASSSLASISAPLSQVNQQSAEVIVPMTASSASGSAIPSPRDNARNLVRQSEADAQSIQSEISTLRETIRERETSSAPQDSGLIASLTARMEQLERNLEAKDRETTRLRRELARTPADSTPSRPAQLNEDDQESESRIASSPAGQVQAAPQSNQQSGAGAPANISGSQASASFGGSNRGSSLAPVTRSAPASGNSALLSKYGVQSSTAQGAITVANPSSTIDYQALRTQSAESFLPLSLSQEEFNQLAGNNQGALDRYLDQVRAMPGEVVRLAITAQGTNSVMEIFVLKNGNQISIVPSNGASRSIASETPVPATAPARDKTLEELRQELSR